MGCFNSKEDSFRRRGKVPLIKKWNSKRYDASRLSAALQLVHTLLRAAWPSAGATVPIRTRWRTARATAPAHTVPSPPCQQVPAFPVAVLEGCQIATGLTQVCRHVAAHSLEATSVLSEHDVQAMEESVGQHDLLRASTVLVPKCSQTYTDLQFSFPFRRVAIVGDQPQVASSDLTEAGPLSPQAESPPIALVSPFKDWTPPMEDPEELATEEDTSDEEPSRHGRFMCPGQCQEPRLSKSGCQRRPIADPARTLPLRKEAEIRTCPLARHCRARQCKVCRWDVMPALRMMALGRVSLPGGGSFPGMGLLERKGGRMFTCQSGASDAQRSNSGLSVSDTHRSSSGFSETRSAEMAEEEDSFPATPEGDAVGVPVLRRRDASASDDESGTSGASGAWDE